jgi:hypothetical protein
VGAAVNRTAIAAQGSASGVDERDERASPPGGATDRGGPGPTRRPTRGGATPPGLKRALSGLERAIGGLVANSGGRADVLLPGEGEASDGLKAAVSDLVDAIGRVTAFTTGRNRAARPIAAGVLGRLEAVVVARLEASIPGAGDAAARLRAYRALAELGPGMPGRALMLVLMEIGHHLGDDQDAIARALAPLTEARRRRREAASAGRSIDRW